MCSTFVVLSIDCVKYTHIFGGGNVGRTNISVHTCIQFAIVAISVMLSESTKAFIPTFLTYVHCRNQS